MCHRIGYGRRVKYVVNTTQRHSIFFLSSFPIFVSIKGAGNGRERCMRETLEKWKMRKSNKWNESTMKRQRHSLFILLTAFSFNQQLLISSNNQLMVRCHRCCAAAVYPRTHSHIKRNRERESLWWECCCGIALLAACDTQQTNMTSWNNKTSMRWNFNDSDVSTTTVEAAAATAVAMAVVDIKIIYSRVFYCKLRMVALLHQASSMALPRKQWCVCVCAREPTEHSIAYAHILSKRRNESASSTMEIQNFAHAIVHCNCK